ncbi:hypothetical protein QUA81_15795 [Microcoleus sp. F6_B4]
MPVPQEIHSLWNRPKSLFLTMVQDLSFNGEHLLQAYSKNENICEYE